MASSPFLSGKVTRRGLLRAVTRLGVGAVGASAGTLGWSRFVEPNWVEIERHDVPLPRLARAFDGLRIAQISDIHIEGGDMRDRLASICRLVSAQKADAIVVTGDFITDLGHWQENALVPGLCELKAPLGVFAVLGNHDHWTVTGQADTGEALVGRALHRAGIRLLSDDFVSWHRGGETVHLCGLDDWSSGFMKLDVLMKRLPPEGAAIVLQHAPDIVDVLAPLHRFDLMLSGHSHGGQIALPLIGPVHLPVGGQKYPRGWYQVQDLRLYTNRGLGTIDLPMRLCSRPEITVFTLRSI